MPSTPFIGLSVMVHLGIIFVYRILGFDNSNKRRSHSTGNGLAAKKGAGLAIIASVLSLIALNAGMLINSAITEKHSSIYFIEQFVQDLTNDTLKNTNNIYSTPNYII